MIRHLFLLTALLFSLDGIAQDAAPKPVFSGYVDAYYAAYTDSVGPGNIQQFPSVAPRGGFGLNTAMLTAQYDGERVRAIATLHYGDIARAAWSPTFNAIMEAHAGLRLTKKLWVDAGFFRTHFGTEGLLPKENIASAVSVCTYYEPYYEAGARLNYLPTDKLTINLYLLNGYNLFEENNSKKSLGLQVLYAFNGNTNIGYTNYIGDDTPEPADTISHLRIHQNLFLNHQWRKFRLQAGGDFGLQSHSTIDAKSTASLYSGVLGLKYQATKKVALYTREEIFNDDDGFMSGLLTDKKGVVTGLKIMGADAGLEYAPLTNAILRIEGRYLQADKDQEIFRWQHGNRSSRLELILNLGVSF